MDSPKIRFKKYNKEWKRFKLGESVILNRFKQISAEELESLNEGIGDVNLLPSSKSYGWKCKDRSEIQHLVNDAEVITVGRARNANTKYSNGKFIASQNHIIESFDKDILKTKFLYYFILQHEKEFYSAESTYPMFTKQDFNDITLSVGEIDEQNEITNLLDFLDDYIANSEQKLEKIKNIKQSFLQKMFPIGGNTVPEIRFKGFEGDWEEFNFTKITYPAGEKNKDNLPLESYSVSNEKGFLPQKEQFENGGSMANADKRMYYIVKPNSFVYNPARINIGSIGYSNLDKDVIVSSLYEVFQTTDNIDDTFLRYRFKTDIFPKLVEKYQEGGVRLYFYYDKLCMCNIRIPKIEEQRKIGKFFLNIDKKIESNEQKLEKLKNLKQSLLQKMFI